MSGSPNSSLVARRSSLVARRSSLVARRSSLVGVAIAVAISFGLFGVVLGTGKYMFGSIAATRAFFRGDKVFFPVLNLDLGALAPKTERAFSFRLRNLTAGDLRVIGVTTTCHCVSVVQPAPIVPPFAERDIRFKMEVPLSTREGSFAIRLNVLLNVSSATNQLSVACTVQ